LASAAQAITQEQIHLCPRDVHFQAYADGFHVTGLDERPRGAKQASYVGLRQKLSGGTRRRN
jgi:hypothetical protein